MSSYQPIETTGGAGCGPAGSIPAGSYYEAELPVDLGAPLLDIEYDNRPLELFYDDRG